MVFLRMIIHKKSILLLEENQVVFETVLNENGDGGNLLQIVINLVISWQL